MKLKRIHVILLVLIFSKINTVYGIFQFGDSNSVHFYCNKLREADKKFFFRHGKDSLTAPVKYSKTVTLKKDISIFGWHPYWMGSTYTNYNYSLLTHVAYFSCDVDPKQGTLRELNGWDTTSIVSYIKKQNPSCKVLLTATCFGQSSISTLLNNEAAKKLLIENLFTAITNKNADGVCIDFEGIASSSKQTFALFITDVKNRFKQKGLQVFITLPAVDTTPSSYDFVSLDKSVDLFVLMSYDYFGSFSDKYNAGPIAPIKTKAGWIPKSLETSVNYYLKNNVPDSMLLLGVPYYGAIWETTSLAIPSGPAHFVGYRSYSYALPTLNNFVNDTTLGISSYCFEVKGTSESNRQFWLDGEYSLGVKYDYVLQKNLKGIGIWALGFDEGSDKLWRLLETKFSKTDSVKVTQPETEFKSVNNLLLFTDKKPSSLGIAVFAVLLTLLIVLLTVISNAANRVSLKSKGLFYLFVLVIVTLFCFNFFVLCMLCFNLNLMYSLISFGAVLVISFAIKTIFKFRNREMP